MTITTPRPSHVRNPRQFFIGGAWVEPSTSATFDVVDCGFKQSGIGRKGGVEGLHPYLETKTMIFETAPTTAL